MDEKKQDFPVNVPYVVHEAAMARDERKEKRLWIAVLSAIAALVITNAIWLYCWMQYDYVSDTYTATQDGGGTNIMSGGSVMYGTEFDPEAQIPD